MKKILSTLFFILIILGLCSCGHDSTTQEDFFDNDTSGYTENTESETLPEKTTAGPTTESSKDNKYDIINQNIEITIDGVKVCFGDTVENIAKKTGFKPVKASLYSNSSDSASDWEEYNDNIVVNVNKQVIFKKENQCFVTIVHSKDTYNEETLLKEAELEFIEAGDNFVKDAAEILEIDKTALISAAVGINGVVVGRENSLSQTENSFDEHFEVNANKYPRSNGYSFDVSCENDGYTVIVRLNANSKNIINTLLIEYDSMR